MSYPGFSFKFRTRTRDEVGRSPSRTGTRRQIVLETLEGRRLLSSGPTLRSSKIAEVDGLPQHPHAGPVLDNIGVGYAVKSPRFYELYNGSGGQFRAELNAAGMKATYDAAGNLVLTGIVAGNITNVPASASGSEFYVFGISHSGVTSLSSFPGRPSIKYDAYVAIGFTPAGVSGYVYDSTTNSLTQLTQANILNQGQDVKVYVPAGTPGIQQNSNGTNPSVVFWAQNTDPSPTPNPDTIASFAPEGRDVLIAGAPGRQPNPILL